jgi:hypothetical protein
LSREEAMKALQGLLEGGQRVVEIRGTSMEPFLRAGDHVRLGPVPPSGPALGDLIAFHQEGNLIVHRFAGWTGRGPLRRLRQKGDNLAGYGLVEPGALVGRVVQVESGKGTRSLLQGPGLWSARLRGLVLWGGCVAREWIRRALGRA